MTIEATTPTELHTVDKSVARKLVAVGHDRVRAEERRLDADAAAERRIREQAELVRLAEQREEAKDNRKERRAAARKKRRDEQRKARTARWGTRVAKLRKLAPDIGRRVILTGPIVFPMAVAWIGQIHFATDVLHWWLPAAVGFAAAWELSTVYVARLAHQARQDGDSAWGFRAGTAFLALAAATMNYWHAADNWSPNPTAVSYGFMSVLGIALWEGYSAYEARKARRAAGTLAEPRPSLGLAYWWRYRPQAWAAYSACIADPSIKTRTDAIDAGERALAAAEQQARRDELVRLTRKAIDTATKKGDASGALRHLARLAELYDRPVPPLTASTYVLRSTAHVTTAADTGERTTARRVSAHLVSTSAPVNGDRPQVSTTRERSAVSATRPGERVQPARVERPIVVSTVPPPAVSAPARTEPRRAIEGEIAEMSVEERMRALWDGQIAKGLIPTGADLAAAGSVSPATGRRRRQEWEKDLPAHLRGGAADDHV